MDRYDITIQMLGVEASGPQYVWEKVPAEEGELVLYTDAQATIAALQVVIDDHNRLVREMDVRLNGEQGAAKQASLCDIVSQVQQIQAQLTQRTAELEAARRERDEWIVKWDEHDHYPKGYVTAQIQLRERVQAELERVRGELVEATHNANVYQSLYSTGCMDRALLENELRDIRTLIAALPKVEGDFDVVARYRNENGSVHLNDEVKALLQHRQGMEG